MTLPQHSNGVERDVEQCVLKSRSRKRRSGEQVYPVAYTKELRIYDDWTTRFLNETARGVCLHPFDEPPGRVLDLGCGTGLWIMEAAKHWPTAELVGFDILSIQPKLDVAVERLKIMDSPALPIFVDLQKRITWVHGDMLEPLPFPSDHFDFVRICCIGYAVPEDEWQDLLEELSRVLKPGGALEIIEEELMFPTGRSPPTPSETSSQGSDRLSPERSNGGANGQSPVVRATSTSTLRGSDHQSNNRGSAISAISFSSYATDGLDDTPQHRLRAAWEKMVEDKFLTSSLLKVLPFYVESCFDHVSVHPFMHFVIPPNAADRAESTTNPFPRHTMGEHDELAAWLHDLQKSTFGGSPDLSSSPRDSRLKPKQPPTAIIKLWGSIHLARAIAIIGACKQPLWYAYARLYRSLTSADRQKMMGLPDDLADGVTLKEVFDSDWAIWYSDMKDRIAMRRQLNTSLAWSDASFSAPQDGWDGDMGPERMVELNIPGASPNMDRTLFCRSMRSFMAWNPS